MSDRRASLERGHLGKAVKEVREGSQRRGGKTSAEAPAWLAREEGGVRQGLLQDHDSPRAQPAPLE